MTLAKERQFAILLESYLTVGEKLAGDSIDGVSALARKIAENASNKTIREAAVAIAEAAAKEDIDRARFGFRRMSDLMIGYVEAHASALGDKPNKVYCPMADASWLQKGTTIANPYYGASMLRCGRIEPWGEQ